MASTAALMAPLPYPWHEGPWEALTRNLAQLPHALLFEGQPGLGKGAFALRLAQTLLCLDRRPDSSACGACQSCHLFTARSHPDLLSIVPEEDGKPITVDQVRALGGFLSLRPHTAAHKVVILQPAETMNLNAANSLLKVLEEPPLGSVLVLVTSEPSRLPATIRSRCSHVRFRTPAREQAMDWLQRQLGASADERVLLDLAGGAPLRALALRADSFIELRDRLLADLEALRGGHDDPITCAVRWKSVGTAQALAWLRTAVADLLRLALAPAEVTLTNPDRRERLQVLANSLQFSELFQFLDAVSEAYRLSGGPLDQSLLLEDLLIRWTRLRA